MYPLSSSAAAEPTYRDKQPCTFTPTGDLEPAINPQQLACSFELWEEAGAPGGEQIRQEETCKFHTESPQTGKGAWL